MNNRFVRCRPDSPNQYFGFEHRSFLQVEACRNTPQFHLREWCRTRKHSRECFALFHHTYVMHLPGAEVNGPDVPDPPPKLLLLERPRTHWHFSNVSSGRKANVF